MGSICGACKKCMNDDDMFIIVWYGAETNMNARLKKEYLAFLNKRLDLLRKGDADIGDICLFECKLCGYKWINFFNRKTWLIEIDNRFKEGKEKEGFCGFCNGIEELSESDKKETRETHRCIKRIGTHYRDFVLPNFFVQSDPCWELKEDARKCEAETEN